MKTFVMLVFLTMSVSMTAAEPPKLVDKEEDYTGLPSFFRMIKCNIDGEDIAYEWFHNGRKVEPTSTRFFLFGKFLATKDPVTEFHQGSYQCKASNEDGTLMGTEINVAFTIVGTFKKSDDVTETVDVTVGKALQLACPPRTFSRNIFYHWGGRQGAAGAWFMPSRQHYMIMEDGALLMSNVKSEDIEYFNVEKNGVSCSIESYGENKQFSFSQRFLLQDIGAPNRVPFGPTMKTLLKDREVEKGTEFIILRCGAVGLPTPDYFWTVTGLDGVERQIISSEEDGYQLQDFNHILMISSLGVKHDGWYKCKASNVYEGSKHTDEMKGRISVKGEPVWATNGNLLDVSPMEGNQFKWVCKAFGNPEPSYTWLLNGIKLTSSNSYDIDGGTITFKSISTSNAGRYRCIAENSYGHISSSAHLKPTPAPTMRCNITKMNVLFLVDGSGSVPSSTFREFKTFMKLLVMKFTVGRDATDVGVLQYSSRDITGLEFAPGEYQTVEAIQNAISKVKYHYGAYTYAGYAMGMAKELFSWYTHRNAKNVLILLMDGGTWDKRAARKHSKELREKEIQIVILDTRHIMHEIADMGLEFTSEKLKSNVEKVAHKICT